MGLIPKVKLLALLTDTGLRLRDCLFYGGEFVGSAKQLRIGWQQIFDGLMLSDGNLHRSGKCFWHRYQQTCANPYFLEWVQKYLPTESKIGGPYRVKGTSYQYWMLKSIVAQYYSTQYPRWYPNGKKVIPADFVVTPLSMLAEYLGDGCSAQTTKAISLGTCGFCREAVERQLVMPLRELGFDVVYYKNGCIAFRVKSMQPFLDFIGDCPVPVYAYKWVICEHW